MKKMLILAASALIIFSCSPKISGPDNNQTGSSTPVVLDKTSSAFDCHGGTDQLVITSSGKLKVTSDAAWCSMTLGAAGKTTTADVFAAANLGPAERTATIKIEGGPKPVTYTVIQAGYSVAKAETAEVSMEEFYARFAAGWNLGNHMDAVNKGVSGETAWGNPVCTQATMNAVKAAGISTVRIPVTWSGHVGPAPEYKIDDKWLDRVAEIAGYCEKAGLNAIVNIHHDESDWLSIKKAVSNNAAKAEILAKFSQMWYQIAQKFADKGDWLVLEACNEIHDGGWGWSDDFKSNPQRQYDVMNTWLDAFVKAVRLTGGENATRWLGIPGYSAGLDFTIAGLVIPHDYTTSNRIAVAFHNYDPSDYTLTVLKSEWGHTADRGEVVVWDGGFIPAESHIVGVMNKAVDNFQKKGFPVYLGEYGCSFRSSTRQILFHKYYLEYFVKAAHDALIPMILWDNGAKGSGSEKHAYIDHGTGEFISYSEDLIGRIVRAATDDDPSYTLQTVYDSAPFGK